MVQKLRSVEVLCGLTVKVETYNTPKGPLQCRQCQRFGHTKRNCGHTPRCVACGAEHASGSCVTGKDEVRCCNCAENHTANYRGCRRFKEARQQLSKRGPTKKTGRPHPRLTPEQEKLGPEWSHVAKNGVVLKPASKPTPPPPNPSPIPQGAPGKAHAAPAGSKDPAKRHTAPRPTSQAVKPASLPSHPLAEIEDLIQDLEPALCRRLTRRLLIEANSLPKGDAREGAILKLVISCILEQDP